MATKKQAVKGPAKKKALIALEDASVILEDGPLEVTTVRVSDLLALGLPSKCTGGGIELDEPLKEGGRWLVFQILGLRFGVGYIGGDEPFESVDVEEGKPRMVDLRVMSSVDGAMCAGSKRAA
jgi:hypothetical protein